MKWMLGFFRICPVEAYWNRNGFRVSSTIATSGSKKQHRELCRLILQRASGLGL